MIRLMILLTFLLILAGCSSDSSPDRQLKADLRESQLNLSTCQSRLEMYTNTSSSTSTETASSEPETPAEPEYEEVEYAQLQGKSHKCYQYELEACGMTFSDCSDGTVYRCMVNAVYKINTEKKLVEKE